MGLSAGGSQSVGPDGEESRTISNRLEHCCSLLEAPALAKITMGLTLLGNIVREVTDWSLPDIHAMFADSGIINILVDVMCTRGVSQTVFLHLRTIVSSSMLLMVQLLDVFERAVFHYQPESCLGLFRFVKMMVDRQPSFLKLFTSPTNLRMLIRIYAEVGTLMHGMSSERMLVTRRHLGPGGPGPGGHDGISDPGSEIELGTVRTMWTESVSGDFRLPSMRGFGLTGPGGDDLPTSSRQSPLQLPSGRRSPHPRPPASGGLSESGSSLGDMHQAPEIVPALPISFLTTTPKQGTPSRPRSPHQRKPKTPKQRLPALVMASVSQQAVNETGASSASQGGLAEATSGSGLPVSGSDAQMYESTVMSGDVSAMLSLGPPSTRRAHDTEDLGFDTKISAMTELTLLAHNLGQSFMTADLSGLIAHKRERVRNMQVADRVRTFNMPGVEQRDVHLAQLVGHPLHQLRIVILQIIEAVLAAQPLAVRWTRAVNVLYMDVLRHVSLPVLHKDTHMLDLLLRVLRPHSVYVEYEHRVLWPTAFATLSLPAKSRSRRKLDRFVWRVTAQLRTLADQSRSGWMATTARLEAIELQLRMLHMYMQACRTRVMVPQVVDVALDVLLDIKNYLFSFGKLVPDRIFVAPAMTALLAVFGEIGSRNTHLPLNSMLLNILVRRRDEWDNWMYFRSFAGRLLIDPEIENAFATVHESEGVVGSGVERFSPAKLVSYQCAAVDYFAVILSVIETHMYRLRDRVERSVKLARVRKSADDDASVTSATPGASADSTARVGGQSQARGGGSSKTGVAAIVEPGIKDGGSSSTLSGSGSPLTRVTSAGAVSTGAALSPSRRGMSSSLSAAAVGTSSHSENAVGVYPVGGGGATAGASSLGEESWASMADMLNSFILPMLFLLHPTRGIAVKVFNTFDSAQQPKRAPLLKAMLGLLEAFFRIPGLPQLHDPMWVDGYVTLHYTQFVKLYHSSEVDTMSMELCKGHLRILRMFALHKNEAIIRKFYQLRVVDFLAREIDVEQKVADIKQRMREKTNGRVRARSRSGLLATRCRTSAHRRPPEIRVAFCRCLARRHRCRGTTARTTRTSTTTVSDIIPLWHGSVGRHAWMPAPRARARRPA
ncbi:uncharacterized protein AMSG_12207 [Thecamonas trahens ATCC 50062]|uniref:Uncharacterized protein n=1 Tax=Thecamonas trahens ATCC 50062 TaxID=461836 RepID=A0A0L0DPJ7_THETB|nr:hypothetical protein AMSG_12207 [Thecamonas trahens ATCC 50062]KNC53353.1 hypothetical protein AMSG_12207 [Thecamonas trahens ATCC 50062]|eukprot:XP_013754483.1 hypothetical protein AMSG_12207 [Thecamonas trahens ATCC 50062]